MDICQKPEVKSRVEKIVNSALPMSPMHLLISFIEYVSIWECWLSSRKSLTIQRPAPFLFGTKNIGDLCIDDKQCTTSNFNNSAISFVRKLWCENGIFKLLSVDGIVVFEMNSVKKVLC